MLLTNAQIRAVKAQAQIEPVPADHDFNVELIRRYGPHTFYLGSGGLYITEPFGVELPNAEPAVFVRIAAWVDETHEKLVSIEPERTEHAVDLIQPA